MLVHVHYDHVEPADKSSEISSYIVVLWYNKQYWYQCGVSMYRKDGH